MRRASNRRAGRCRRPAPPRGRGTASRGGRGRFVRDATCADLLTPGEAATWRPSLRRRRRAPAPGRRRPRGHQRPGGAEPGAYCRPARRALTVAVPTGVPAARALVLNAVLSASAAALVRAALTPATVTWRLRLVTVAFDRSRSR